MDITASVNTKFMCNLHLNTYSYKVISVFILSDVKENMKIFSVVAHRDGQIYTEPDMVSKVKGQDFPP